MSAHEPATNFPLHKQYTKGFTHHNYWVLKPAAQLKRAGGLEGGTSVSDRQSVKEVFIPQWRVTACHQLVDHKQVGRGYLEALVYCPLGCSAGKTNLSVWPITRTYIQ